MSSVISSINDDIEYYSNLLDKSGLDRSQFPECECYSDDAKYVKTGYALGYRGEILMAFINKLRRTNYYNQKIIEENKKFHDMMSIINEFNNGTKDI